jgi:hypothetical protein
VSATQAAALDMARDILQPADLLVVRLGGIWSEVIRLGEHMAGLPDDDNHVAVMHHCDGEVPWGLEGRPGGVGWVDLRGYLKTPRLVNNCGQPGRDQAARYKVAEQAKTMIGTAYDWQAIGDDVLRAFRMPQLFARHFTAGKSAGAVICSSLAEFLYETAGWDHPVSPHDRDIEPADWEAFSQLHGYNRPIPTWW